MSNDPTPKRLDQPDVTETERALIRQLRTATGRWIGDETALRVIREYTARERTDAQREVIDP